MVEVAPLLLPRVEIDAALARGTDVHGSLVGLLGRDEPFVAIARDGDPEADHADDDGSAVTRSGPRR